MGYSLHVYGKKTYINFKFSGERKGGQNNKVSETLRLMKI